MFPFMFPETSFTAAADNVPKIAALTGVSGGNVLDLACGPGRYAIPLAQAGYVVTGVDRTRFLLKIARERAGRAAANVEWVEQDMREFLRPAAFDLALNVFTSFGYFEDQAENRRVLENIFASLKPGGAFVFDHLGKEVLAAQICADALPEPAGRHDPCPAPIDHGRLVANRWRMDLARGGPCHDLPPPALALLRSRDPRSLHERWLRRHFAVWISRGHAIWPAGTAAGCRRRKPRS